MSPPIAIHVSPPVTARCRRCFAPVAVAGLVLAAAGPAAAAPSTDVLSPRLATLATASVRARTAAGQADAVDLPQTGPGSLVRKATAVVVQVRLDADSGPRIAALRAAGADVTFVDDARASVDATIDPAKLAALRGVDGVLSVTEALAPQVRDACAPKATSQGDAQVQAAGARSATGLDGSGVEVGVLSDSFDRTSPRASADVASGDLPGAGNPCGHTTPVDVAAEGGDSDDDDEGRGMAQIVHDLAPGAKLAFATVGDTDDEFAAHIALLAQRGAKVLVDDVGFLDEPWYQDGPIAEAITSVTNAGVSYFTASGNESSGGRGSYEAPAYRPTSGTAPANGCPSALGSLAPDSCMDFDPSPGVTRNVATVNVGSGGAQVVLQWAEPVDGVKTDLDLVPLTSAGAVVTKTGETDNLSSGEPFEVVNLRANTTDRLAIARTQGSGTPRLKMLGYGDVTFTDTVSSPDVAGETVAGHPGTPAAIAVGAVAATAAQGAAVGNLEDYSSYGNSTALFAPVTGSSPAAALPSPVVTHKPDLAASDCVSTTFFPAPDDIFCGTSAAAPHAAAVAALALQKDPSATPAAIRSALTSTAGAVGGQTAAGAAGAGLVNAVAALAALPDTRAPAGSTTTTPTTTGTTPTTTATAIPTPTATLPTTTTPGKTPTLPPGTTATPTTVRPIATLGTHPAKTTRSHRARFTFTIGASGATYRCRLDSGASRSCHSPKTYTVKPGHHRFSLRATNRAGTASRAVVFTWTVRRGSTAR